MKKIYEITKVQSATKAITTLKGTEKELIKQTFTDHKRSLKFISKFGNKKFPMPEITKPKSMDDIMDNYTIVQKYAEISNKGYVKATYSEVIEN